MSKEIQLMYFEKCEQIKHFDILVSDPHAGDEFTKLSDTTYLTLQEVWAWLCEGGDWSFKVIAHAQPDKVFMRGSLYHDNVLRHAAAGEMPVHLCFATEEEANEIKEKAHARIRKAMNLE
jgi:hypothetical protein